MSGVACTAPRDSRFLLSARSSLVWGYGCCRLFGFQARHTSLPVTLPSCYSPRHTHGNNTVGAGLGTADCGYVWDRGNKKRTRGTRESPLSSLLSQSRTYMAPEIGWPSFTAYVMVSRAADDAHKVCASLCKAAAHLRALCRRSCLKTCDVRVSLTRASPPALPAPEDGKSA